MAQGQPAVTDSACKACQGTWPRRDHFIAELGLTTAYLHDDQFFAGWTILVLKRHATELFHLSRDERARLMEEVSRTAQVLSDTFQARKINYELLGNQLTHIHWHLIPRLGADPAPLKPVWQVEHTPRSLQGPALQDLIASIETRLVAPPSRA
jgi:diadenosine tetraphosphate (Ap4A) HIT family hydrolase